MAKAIATGQISIIDYTDAPSLSGWISTTSPKTQAYEPTTDTYVPNWESTNPVLIPSLLVSSMGTADQISNATVTWYDSTEPSTPITTNDDYEIEGKNLRVKRNLLTGEIYSKTYLAKIVWRENITGAQLTVTADFTFNRANHGIQGPAGADGADGVDGVDAIIASAWAPQGNMFRNDSIKSLTAQVEVYKGGTVLDSDVTYAWYVQKTGTEDQGAGTGWLKLTSSNAEENGVVGSTTSNVLTITPDAVTNVTAFKVIATYKEKEYTDTVVFYDQTDPIMVVVDSSAGNIFKNGNISSRLTCRLYQNGEEIDVAGSSATEGYKYTYTWSKVNADGNQDLEYAKTGKWIDITDKDVNQKAVFRVEIS